MDALFILAENTAHELNHTPMRCLNHQTACGTVNIHGVCSNWIKSSSKKRETTPLSDVMIKAIS